MGHGRRVLIPLLAAATLVACGGTEDRAALLAAAYANDVETARPLIEAGADVNAKDDSEQSAYLIATSEVGDDPRLLELTLDAGALIDDKDSFDGTGLIRAAERGHVRIVRRLLAADIDRDHVNELGWTALHEAIVLGDGGRDRSVVRPLTHAVRLGNDEIATLLRAAGARP